MMWNTIRRLGERGFEICGSESEWFMRCCNVKTNVKRVVKEFWTASLQFLRIFFHWENLVWHVTASERWSTACGEIATSSPLVVPLPMRDLDHHLILGSVGPHESTVLKLHLDRFSRFYRAHQKGKHTNHASPSVAICRIQLVLRCGLKLSPQYRA